MYSYTAGSVIGLPHSSHSSADSGSSGSRMVVRASTNGTAATIAAYFSGARLATAPISRPPAEPPMAAIRAGSTQPDSRQPVGGRDEVREGVLLLQLLAGVVPVPAQFPAAADVGDHEHDAPVQQGQPGDAEAGIHAHLVGAVAVHQAGRRRVPLHRGVPQHRERNPGPVGRHGPLAGGDVVRGGVAAQHRAFLAQQQLAGGLLRGGQHKVVDPRRREVGRVAHPDHGRLVVGAGRPPRCRAPPRRRAPPARPAPACPARPAAAPARARSCPCGWTPPGASR